ncbi:hypothetical protein INT48_001324 [Thamnidium elegans]|uniref:RING-type domain-containing protein n=1 Tax=Thamnidium elegans TaxID=101142 RepID=A0A8H7SGB6_9FUNG|nr:hypothetical protein INT48_001324 [Thamnidium elegans]
MNAEAPSFVPPGSHGGNSGSRNNNKQKKRQEKKRDNKVKNESVPVVPEGSTDKKGRGVSLNHLLGFSFPQRQESPMPTYRKTKTASYQPFNKERFINANFRFMLNASGNYMYQLADPDINFDWDTIEQVLISSSESQLCPICLSPPNAARVTKCGHIYCLPCILHYLALRENTKRLWRKCPICWDSIYQADLKPVRIMKPYAVADHRTATVGKASLGCGVTEGDRIDMVLIQRANHSTLAFPLSDTWPLPSNVIYNYIKPDMPLIPWHFMPSAMEFARFMLASPDYLEAEYRRDCLELKEALSDANGWGSVEEIGYIEASETLVNEKIKIFKAQQQSKEVKLAIQTWDMMFEAVAKYSKRSGKLSAQVVPEQEKEHDVPEAYRQYQLHQAGEDGVEEPTQRRRNPIPSHDNKPATDFYFYQAVDGQHVYLHPLDIRILKHEFREYENFPRTIQVQATNVEESTLTEDLRKKCKYLGHLPLACDVTFLEINVKEIVSAETVAVFQQELSARVKKRKDKERREDQKKKQSETKHKLHVAKEQESERKMLESDPFFSMYQPAMTEQESEDQLSLALSESASISSSYQESSSAGPKTVWGTRKVASREEELFNEANEWADHIVINKSQRKRRGKKH